MLFVRRCRDNTVNWNLDDLMLGGNVVDNCLDFNNFSLNNWHLTKEFDRYDSCFSLSDWNSFLDYSINWHWSNWLRSNWHLHWLLSYFRYWSKLLIDYYFSFSMNFRFTDCNWLSNNFLDFNTLGNNFFNWNWNLDSFDHMNLVGHCLANINWYLHFPVDNSWNLNYQS